MWIQRLAFAAILHVAGASVSTSMVCSPSCLARDDIISCRRFSHADIVSCYRQHQSATVLDLSYIAIDEPLTAASFSGLDGLLVIYLDGTRFSSTVDIASLTAMPRLRTVYLRRLASSLGQLVAAVVASASVREVGLADNYVVCSCDWVTTVGRLAANDVAIIDWADTAPQCAPDAIKKCTSEHTSSTNTRQVRQPTVRSKSLVDVFMTQLASLDASKTVSDYQKSRPRRNQESQSVMKKNKRDAGYDDFGLIEKSKAEDDDKLQVDLVVDRSSAKRDDDDDGGTKQSLAQQDARWSRDKQAQQVASAKVLEADDVETDELGREKQQFEKGRKTADKKAAEKAANRLEKAAADEDDVDDVGERDVEEHSKREETGDMMAGAIAKRMSSSKKSGKNRSSHKTWIAHPGTIALIVSLCVLFVLIFVYFLTPCKMAVDQRLPAKPLIGGGSASKNYSRSNSSYNASPNAAPSSEAVGEIDSSEEMVVAKETTPLVSATAASDSTAKKIEDDKAKDKKDKKDRKWKVFNSHKSTENNVNENHGGREQLWLKNKLAENRRKINGDCTSSSSQSD